MEKKTSIQKRQTYLNKKLTLLVNYFFIPEMPILTLSDLQNSISFGKRVKKIQGFQNINQCFANSVKGVFKQAAAQAYLKAIGEYPEE